MRSETVVIGWHPLGIGLFESFLERSPMLPTQDCSLSQPSPDPGLGLGEVPMSENSRPRARVDLQSDRVVGGLPEEHAVDAIRNTVWQFLFMTATGHDPAPSLRPDAPNG
jgi:hypothetical protein